MSDKKNTKKDNTLPVTETVAIPEIVALEKRVKRLEGFMNKVSKQIDISTPAPKLKAKALTAEERVFEAKVKDAAGKESTMKFQLSNVKAIYNVTTKTEVPIVAVMKDQAFLQSLVDIKSGLVCPLN